MSADFWAGYISGAASIVLGNPLDVLKVRLQAGVSRPSSSPASPALSAAQPPPASATASFASAYIRPFLLGTAAPVLGYGALNALLFVSYNRAEAFLNRYLTGPDSAAAAAHGVVLAQDDDGFPTRGANLLATWLAGAAGGLATWVVSAPTELIKCRAQLEIPARITAPSAPSPSTSASLLPRSTPALQQQQQQLPQQQHRQKPPSSSSSSSSSSASSLSIARSILRTHGIRGLYFGGGVTAVRDSVGYGFYFWGYELCSRWMARLAPPGSGGVWSTDAARVLLCGGLAGIITWASIFPLDVIKTRMQAQPDVFSSRPPRTTRTAAVAAAAAGAAGETTPPLGGARGERSEAPRTTAWAVAKDTYREGGARAFFRGLGVCSARAFVVNAAQWAVYEWIMAELGQGRRGEPQEQQQQQQQQQRGGRQPPMGGEEAALAF
ncbi:hypothetical protein VTJ83DRAFT_2938 [Remersonia thermophila]|uniref:Mitochondrial carrier protein n=1 Tax=Remersonia thermophila TaxID=72144 RepID=A0ABR4DCS8_9PEZI